MHGQNPREDEVCWPLTWQSRSPPPRNSRGGVPSSAAAAEGQRQANDRDHEESGAEAREVIYPGSFEDTYRDGELGIENEGKQGLKMPGTKAIAAGTAGSNTFPP